MVYFHSKRHGESNKTNENDWKWNQMSDLADFCIFFLENGWFWKHERRVFHRFVFHIDRCRICYFYWEIFIVFDKSQNFANYGWFLEILGKMTDSRNRWRNQIQKIVFRLIDAQYATFIDKWKAFRVNLKNGPIMADFCNF